MSSNHDRRMRLLEVHSNTVERRTLTGLVRLVESGKLTIHQLTDQELERLATLPGEMPNMRELSDEELESIVRGNYAT